MSHELEIMGLDRELMSGNGFAFLCFERTDEIILFILNRFNR